MSSTLFQLSVKRIPRRPLILLLLLVLAIAGAVSASGWLGALAGTVMDAQGKPVAGATVTMQTSDGMNAHATHTDAEGRFQFTRYQPGQYDLRAYARGAFSDWTKRVLIRTGKTTEITLRVPTPGLTPAAAPEPNSSH
jgi:Carboxypeptidase regulatory-like domain